MTRSDAEGGMVVLTKERILLDIEGFNQRIQAARDKLASLPATASSYGERKKIKEKRRVLQREMEHINTLISYARQALKEATN